MQNLARWADGQRTLEVYFDEDNFILGTVIDWDQDGIEFFTVHTQNMYIPWTSVMYIVEPIGQ